MTPTTASPFRRSSRERGTSDRVETPAPAPPSRRSSRERGTSDRVETPAPAPPTVPTEAPAPVATLVASAPRPGTVVHAGRDAVYVLVDGTCIGVLSRHAVQVPCGVRTFLPALPRFEPGTTVAVGDGRIVLPGLHLSVMAAPASPLPRLDNADRHWAAAALPELVDVAEVRALLPSPALTALAAGDPTCVPALLGLGPGLTPLGDDVLCGWLATYASYEEPDALAAAVRDAVLTDATTRTTALSAALLRCATRGETVPEFQALVRALGERDADHVRRAADALLGIGATSGAGLLLGTLLALAPAP